MNKYILTAVAMAFSLSALAQSKKVATINVKDESREQYASPRPGKHKHHDVEVLRVKSLTLTTGDGYVLRYYQTEGDSIRTHQAISVSDDYLDKADYIWNKDTISVRIYNNVTNKEVKFRAYGHGSKSSMLTD